MLSKKYRFYVDNQSNANVSVTFAVTPKKFDASNALQYGSQVVPTPVSNLANASQDQSGEVDNQTTLMLEGDAKIEATGTGALDCYVYLQRSEDGTTWPSEPGEPLVIFTDFATTGTQSAVVNIA